MLSSLISISSLCRVLYNYIQSSSNGTQHMKHIRYKSHRWLLLQWPSRGVYIYQWMNIHPSGHANSRNGLDIVFLSNSHTSANRMIWKLFNKQAMENPSWCRRLLAQLGQTELNIHRKCNLSLQKEYLGFSILQYMSLADIIDVFKKLFDCSN